MKEKTKVVVTGAAGFIGSHLTDTLVEGGYGVLAIDNLSGGFEGNVNKQANFLKIDVRDFVALKEAIKGAEFVFHLAALPSVQYSIDNPLQTHDVNVNGLLNVLESAKSAGIKRVIFSSSSAVYGDQEILPIKESAETKPKSPYALHKLVGEFYCDLYSRLYGLETVSLRYFNVYGERQKIGGAYASVIENFLNQKKAGEKITITGDGNQTRDFINVADVVEANIKTMLSPKISGSEVINIGSGIRSSINEIAEYFESEIIYVPKRNEPRDSLSDIKKAKEILDWSPNVSLEGGIRALIKNIS